MHQCQNNTGGNISHLEQMVNSFLPYSQEKLGFDKPVRVVFQSDPSNADILLGKTAHYDPQQFEVYLYTDKRHPKDILRSLSHELVHHAQNCRGDFGSCNDTSPGYAQRDPHLRKMEREAYTKGNLIFRDFEDLIKSGKITIDINFKDSGEPQMSLKEWKDNELNMLLMKKWGLLKEVQAVRPERKTVFPKIAGHRQEGIEEAQGHEGSCDDAHPDKNHKEYMAGLKGQGGGKGDEHYQFDKKEREAELEEGEVDESYIDLARSRGQLHKTIDPEVGEDPDRARAYGAGPRVGAKLDPERDRMEIPAWKDPLDTPTRRHDDPIKALGPEDYGDDEPPPPGERVRDPRHLQRTTARVPAVEPPFRDDDLEASSKERLAYEKDPAHFAGIGTFPGDPGEGTEGWETEGDPEKERAFGAKRRKAFGRQFKEGKISVREAKEITRRIIERIRKEGR